MWKRKMKLIRQKTSVECGPSCLAMIFHYYGINTPLSDLSHRCNTSRDGVNALILKEVGTEYGFECKAFKVSEDEDLLAKKKPAILFWNNNHYVVLEKIKKGKYSILDPGKGKFVLSKEEFWGQFSQVILEFTPTKEFKKKKKEKKQTSIKEYLKYILLDRKLVALLLLISLLVQLVGVASPLLTQYFIDNITDKQTYVTKVLGISCISFFLSYLLLSYIRTIAMVRLQVLINEKMSTDFIVHLFKLPIKFFEQRTIGDISTRMNNINTIREILSNSGAAVLLDMMMIVVFSIIIFYYSFPLALLTIGIAVLQILITVWIIPKLKKLTQQELVCQSDTQTYLMESLRAFTLVKTSNSESTILSGWSNLFKNQLGFFAQRTKINGLLGSAIGSISIATPLVILWYGSKGISQGTLTIGALVAFSSIATSFLTPIVSTVSNLQAFQYLNSVFERLQDVLRAEPERVTGEKLIDPISDVKISFENVSFSYDDSDQYVLNNISFQIKPGQKIGIVGTSGSGKTSLTKLILGLYKPTKGKIFFGKQDISEIQLHSLRESMSVVLQDTSLFNNSINNNISFFQNYPRQEIEQAAKLAELHESIEKFPMGYDTIIGENGQNLSGGQRQRLSIARAIVSKPSLLVLDESTSHLDTITEQKINENLDKNGITRVVIAHRLSTIQDSDLILVIENGVIIQSGVHNELLQTQGLYKYLWGKQQNNHHELVPAVGLN